MYIRLFRDPNPPAGGGAAPLPPSLADLSGDGIKPGDGTVVLPNLANTPAAPKPGEPGYVDPNPPVVLKPGEPGYAEPPKPKPGDPNYVAPKPGEPGYVAPKTAEEAAEETRRAALTPEQRSTEDANVAKGLNPDGTPVEEVDEEAAFWDTVEKVTGRKIEVKYPDGVDSLSPQGVALREEAVRDSAIDDFEEYLQTTDPRSYAYMLHRRAGKPDSEFFGDSRGYQLPTLDAMKQSAEMQSAVYRYDLSSRGLDDETVDQVVKKAIADNKLLERATVSHTSIDKGQKDQLAALQQQNAAIQRRADEAVGAMSAQVTKTIDTAMNLIVPEARKAEFNKFILDNMRYDEQTGKFMIVQEVNPEGLNTQLEAMLFQFLKGDMSAMIQKKADTKVGQRLRTAAARTVQAGVKDQGVAGTEGKKLTLGEV